MPLKIDQSAIDAIWHDDYEPHINYHVALGDDEAEVRLYALAHFSSLIEKVSARADS